MHTYLRVLFTIFCSALFLNICAQKINICIYYYDDLRTVILSPEKHSYKIESDASNFILNITDAIYIQGIGDSLIIKTLEGIKHKVAYLKVSSDTINNFAIIKPVLPDLKTRNFEDDFVITAEDNSLKIINKVNLEKYVAGVVEAEGGTTAPIEYYKSQAILARTYTMQSLDRHIFEKFHLCDKVHCQAYHGMSVRSENIIKSVKETSGLIVVHNDTNLITATFHSNCGGQTSQAEHVWVKPVSYLTSVKDPYCTRSRNAKWTKEIDFDKWTRYLKGYGIPSNGESLSRSEYVFAQPYRKEYYKVGTYKIALKNIRLDWKLRSTFFSVNVEDNKIVLSGKGYGHGVGLCQEGAMAMARKGITYQAIIKHYFKNVNIIQLRSLYNTPKKKPSVLPIYRPPADSIKK